MESEVVFSTSFFLISAPEEKLGALSWPISSVYTVSRLQRLIRQKGSKGLSLYCHKEGHLHQAIIHFKCRNLYFIVMVAMDIMVVMVVMVMIIIVALIVIAIMATMIIMVIMVVMVIRTDKSERTDRTDRSDI